MATVSRDSGSRAATRPPGIRHLVLHADDFGMNECVNAGILRAFTHGVLTSTSVLTNAPACASALFRWRELQSHFFRDDIPALDARRRLADSSTPFDLGIHLNLTQGRPLTANHYPPQLLDSDGLFPGVFGLAGRFVTSRWNFTPEIERELCTQIEVLLDSGIAPTHLNAHQYIDILPAVAVVIPGLLKRYAISVTRVPWERHLTRTALIHRFEPAQWFLAQIKRLFAFRHRLTIARHGTPHPASFFGTAHAGRIDFNLMQTFVEAAGGGLTEIGMHPGLPHPAGASHETTGAAADGWNDPLAALRSDELALLTSCELVELLDRQQIRLARLSDLAAEGRLGIAA